MRVMSTSTAAARARIAWNILAIVTAIGLAWALGHFSAPCESSDIDPSLTTCVAPWED